MTYVLAVIAFVLIFSLLVLVHEFGHFWMAKRAGIKVEEFGFGLPPRAWGKKIGETIYSLNWIPFGGFVRMLGEDSRDAKFLKNKRSFISQSLWARFKVIVAGVFMNFLLAWILITIGLLIGIKPMWIAPEDVLPAISEGVMEVQNGVQIKDVEAGSLADKVGFKAGDIIYSVTGKDISRLNFREIFVSLPDSFKIIRDGKPVVLSVSDEIRKNQDSSESKIFGLLMYEYTAFPRAKIFNVDPESVYYKYGFRKDDYLISVNGKQIFSVLDYEEFTRGQTEMEFEVYRDGLLNKVFVQFDKANSVIISDILPESPAAKVGFKPDDVIVSINGKDVSDPTEVISINADNKSEILAYVVKRGDTQLFLEVKPEDGKIGAALSKLSDYSLKKGITLYDSDLLGSMIKLNEIQFPISEAPFEAFSVMYGLGKTTATMFISFVGGFFSSLSIPDGVSGPVGIAQLTYVFVQEGFKSVLAFVALLSLSLAVINILPFPALDGGRLLFIIIEAISGRRVNQKWESIVHMIGYVLILILILAITYSDILRLLGLK